MRPYNWVFAPRRATLFALSLLVGTIHTSVNKAVAQPSNPNLEISASHVTGYANFVTGRNGASLPAPVQGKAASATDLLRTYGYLFGIENVDQELAQVSTRTDRLGHRSTTFHQYHDGVRVFSGVLKTHQNARGDFVAANGDFYPVRSARLSVTPHFSLDDAVLFAKGVIDEGSPAVESSELVIVDPGWYGDPRIGPHLAYYLILTDLAVGLREALFVDAHSGVILDQWNANYSAMDRRVYIDSGGLPGIPARFEGQPPVSIFDVDAAYDFAGDVYGYFDRAFGRDSIDDMGLPLVLTVGETYACPNAGWIPPLKQAIFCEGVVCDDVVAHEFAHGLVQETADLIYQNESGQLNESYADIFGELVDLYNGGAAVAGPPSGSWPPTGTGPQTDTPNNLRTGTCSADPTYADGYRWLIGEDASALGGAIRDMWDPTCFGHPDKVSNPLQSCNPFDNGGVHSGSGIPNHAFAMLVDGKTFNGTTVAPLGTIKAAAVWYRALTTYMTPGTSFFEASLALSQAAQDLIGTFPLDPETGLPSTSEFVAADHQATVDAVTAVEMTIGGAACRGACCDQLAGNCQDYVMEIDCDGDFTPGSLCGFLQVSCVEPGPSARMVVMLDRTGSMQAVTRVSTGNTRCKDALDQAKLDVQDFMSGEPGRAVSVWTFADDDVIELTSGFVDEATALVALDALDGVFCSGVTPLAEALCAAAGAFPDGLARTDKVLAISSDGEENNSSGSCAGPSSQTFPPPPGNYDVGSWQRETFITLAIEQLVTIRHWGTFSIPAGGETGPTIDVETGLPRVGPVSGDQVFFQDLVGQSGVGGGYTQIDDEEPPVSGAPITINEIRTDNPGVDTDEFFELFGPPNDPLDGLTYVVIGDGLSALGSGVIESATSLDGFSLSASGYFSGHKSGTSATCTGYDAEVTLSFENDDNVTHLLVRDFTANIGVDLDLDDDGILDVQPWTSVDDCVALIDDAGGGELVYCVDTIGPDGASAPQHIYRCGSEWNIGNDVPCVEDTPSTFNSCTSVSARINEIRVDNAGGDTDEYFELKGASNANLTGLTYLVIGDGGLAGSGVVESITDLTGQSLGEDGYLAVHKQGTVGVCSGYDVDLPMNFENDDNVTHLLVSGFTGTLDMDLDTDDDGVLDQTPWDDVLSCVALMASLSSGDLVYCFQTVGPDQGTSPAHVFLCTNTWNIGVLDPVCTDDTPSDPNACDPAVPMISEIRTDQEGTDTDEYFELSGVPSQSLDGYTYLVIGDGTGGSGVIENVTDLAGLSLQSDGYLSVHKEGTMGTCGGYDVERPLNFENADNVTHLLVRGFSGSSGADLDLDDDGVLDVQPWNQIVDCVALVEDGAGGEKVYCTSPLGPLQGGAPEHVYRCDGEWIVGTFTGVCVGDTPGEANLCVTDAPSPRRSVVTLLQNKPNPFNPTTRIPFKLSHRGTVSLQVYDLAGRLVTTLVEGERSAGDHVVDWNGTDASGFQVSSGVYLYRLRANGFDEIRRMVLLK